jgi:anti-anti-sigma regulatory factor
VTLDASGVDNLDSTAARMLAKLATDYGSRRVSFRIINVKDEVRDVMDAAGVVSE